jgi:hypothetical protein
MIESIPSLDPIDGFWTPTEQDVMVADRVFRELLESAAKDPTILFPDLDPNLAAGQPDSLAHEQMELELVVNHYHVYQRQYVGIIINGTPLVFCNYADGPQFDSSRGYLFIQKVFLPGGSVHFLQGRFDPELKTCSNVALIGSWPVPER